MTAGAPRVVVVGAGHAGVQLADSLRSEGFSGDIVLVEQEPGLPYQRPPLSKEHLADGTEPEPLALRGEAFYASADIDLRAGTRVTSVDRSARRVTLSDGEELFYTYLVFATGASNRALEVPGVDLQGVLQLRTLTDADRLRNALPGVRSAAVVGAGFIGLEFAAAAAKRGIRVTVVEAADGPMRRVLSAPMSSYFVDALGALGLDVRYGEGVAEITGKGGHVCAVLLSSGESVPADVVVVGIGAVPNQELAASCGLPTGGGVIVDDSLQTPDPSVFAIGDCARYPSVHADASTRLESVQNATDHARHLAARIAGGPPAAYTQLPWFWSVQGPIRLTIVGLSSPHLHAVERGDRAAGKFSVFSFGGDGLVCVESVNAAADHLAARRMLTSGHLPTPEQVADPSFDLKAFSKHQPATGTSV